MLAWVGTKSLGPIPGWGEAVRTERDTVATVLELRAEVAWVSMAKLRIHYRQKHALLSLKYPDPGSGRKNTAIHQPAVGFWQYETPSGRQFVR